MLVCKVTLFIGARSSGRGKFNGRYSFYKRFVRFTMNIVKKILSVTKHEKQNKNPIFNTNGCRKFLSKFMTKY